MRDKLKEQSVQWMTHRRQRVLRKRKMKQCTHTLFQAQPQHAAAPRASGKRIIYPVSCLERDNCKITKPTGNKAECMFKDSVAGI